MRLLVYIFIIFFYSVGAQQTSQYTQFTLNKYGYNPAAAGTNINGKFEIICGNKKQWIGFDRAPASNFFSGNYTFKPKRSYKRWHNAGIYMNNERYGMFQNFSIYGSYTLHLPLSKKLTASFGTFLGARRFSVMKSFIPEGDPVKTNSDVFLWAYPDVIPGFRLYSKKMFLDISVHQIYKNKQTQNDRQIGNQSKLKQQIYVSYGQRIFFDNGYTIVPAINLHSGYTSLPSIEFNLMAYYKKRIGAGVGIRGKNFGYAVLQLKVFKTSMIGMAYEYSINRLNSGAPNSFEIMYGITPFMNLEADKIKNSVAKCPTFDF